MMNFIKEKFTHILLIFIIIILASILFYRTMTNNSDDKKDYSYLDIIPNIHYIEGKLYTGDIREYYTTIGTVEINDIDNYECSECTIEDITVFKGQYVTKGNKIFKNSLSEIKYDSLISRIEILPSNNINITAMNYENIEINFFVEQDFIYKIKRDSRVIVNYGKYDYEAKIIDYGVEIDEQGLVYVKAVMKDDLGFVRNNGKVSIQIEIGIKHNALIMDKQFLHKVNDDYYIVEVINSNGEIEIRNVEIGTIQGEAVEIISGIYISEIPILR